MNKILRNSSKKSMSVKFLAHESFFIENLALVRKSLRRPAIKCLILVSLIYKYFYVLNYLTSHFRILFIFSKKFFKYDIIIEFD
jgi:hypothetical protein